MTSGVRPNNKININGILIAAISFMLISTGFLFGAEAPITSKGPAVEPGNTIEASIQHQLEYPRINKKNNNFGDHVTQNQGQVRNELVRFYIQGKGIWFLEDSVVFKIMESRSRESGGRESDRSVVLKLKFEGCNKAEPKGAELLAHRSNFFYGNDPSKWYTNVANYKEIVYENLYDNIDLRYYSTDQGLKYDLIVQPGGDPNDIMFRYEGAQKVFVDPFGDLVVNTPLGDIIDSELFIYQEPQAVKNEIDGKFRIFDTTRFGFEITDDFDSNKPLIIDPILIYSTYIGGSNDDYGNDIEIGPNGHIYITGSTNSIDYPNTTNANDTTYNGLMDVFVLKIDPIASTLMYSTFIGGSINDEGTALEIDPSGNAYITGSTISSNFPSTPGAYDDTHNNNFDIFVLKLNQMGALLLFSTFIGGGNGDNGNDIALDSSNNIYITGDTWSSSFPISPGAFDSSWDPGWVDACFCKLDATGSSLMYSTFIGGHGNHDKGKGITVDGSGKAYITGETWSSGYPTKAGAYDASYNGEGDAFITILNPAGSGSSDLIYSTFIGGNDNDYGYDIKLDTNDIVYITGFTESTDFPFTSGAYDTSQNGGIDVYVLKLNPSGSGSSDLVYSTFVGGGVSQWGAGIAIDANGNIYVSGPTISTDFPTTLGSYDTIHNGNWDGFVFKLDPTGSSLLYSTFFGGSNEDSVSGIAIDTKGNVYTTGYTISIDFPKTQNAYDPTYNGNKDIFAFNLNLTRFYVKDLGVSAPYVYRTDSLSVYANGNHTYDIEPELQPHFEFCAPGEVGWGTQYFSTPHYNNSSWEISFIPPLNATLGAYDLRVKLNDTKMAFTKWRYLNDSFIVKNNNPVIENLTLSTNLAIFGDRISLWINSSDVEEPEMNLTIEVEYRVPNEQDWNTTYLDTPKYFQNRWECNFTCHFDVPFGDYDFRARFNDSDGNYSRWLYRNDSLLIYNTPPKVIDIGLSDNALNRTESLFIFINSTDHETFEAMLTPFLQYKQDIDSSWSDLTMKYSDAYFRWKAEFSTDANSSLGSYDLRVRFEDAEVLSCDWVELNNSFRVLNNVPNVVDLQISRSEVLRNNSLAIFVNGSDIEDLEGSLLCGIEYKLPTGDWLELDELSFQNERWRTTFTPPPTADLGMYGLRVNFKDSDYDYSEWMTVEDAFEVQNNLPIITEDLDDLEIGFYAENLDLTPFGSDIEDDVEDLSWMVDQSTVDTTLFQAVLIIEPGNILYIVPWDNVTGEDEIRLSLIDKDGGTATRSDITIHVNSILTILTPKVTLLTPLDESTVNTLTPTLDWILDYDGTNLITYTIFIDDNPDPQTILQTGLTTTSFTLENELENHKRYYWKVIPKGGICLSDPYSFIIDLGFFPYYGVNLTVGTNYLTLKPGDSTTLNVTLRNDGNVNDIYIIKMNVDDLIEYVEFGNLNDIALPPPGSETQQILFSLSEDTPINDFNLTITATSFYGGDAVNDSKVIHVDIEPELVVEIKDDTRSNIVLLAIWLIIILMIIIGIVVAALIRKRKKLKAEPVAQERAMEGGVPSLELVSAQGAAPQLGTVGQAAPPIPTLGVTAGSTSPPPVPQIAQPEVRPQLPPAQLGIGDAGQAQQWQSQKLSNEVKLKLLEERFLNGDIDQGTYLELRTKYQTAIDVQLSQGQPRLPPAPSEAVTEPVQEPLATDLDEDQSSSDSDTDTELQNKCPKCNSILINNPNGSASCIKCDTSEELQLKNDNITGGNGS